MPDTFTAMPTHRSPAAPPACTWLPARVPSYQEKGHATGCDLVLNLDKTVGQLYHLLTDFQFGLVCEVILPIGQQARSAVSQSS